MEPELVILDCDGVLVDSEAIVIEATLLAEAGFAMTVDDCADQCVGLRWLDVTALLEARFGRSVPPGLTTLEAPRCVASPAGADVALDHPAEMSTLIGVAGQPTL